MKKPQQYNDIIVILQKLKHSHPSLSMGQHISSIVYEYGDIWGLSDKEFLFALQKYKTSLELDFEHSPSDIEDIIKQGMHLDTILEEQEEE